jgi:hypothetical protein
MAHRTKNSEKPLRVKALNARISEDTKKKLDSLLKFYSEKISDIKSYSDVLEYIIADEYQENVIE